MIVKEEEIERDAAAGERREGEGKKKHRGKETKTFEL